jgi:hypothetical protein
MTTLAQLKADFAEDEVWLYGTNYDKAVSDLINVAERALDVYRAWAFEAGAETQFLVPLFEALKELDPELSDQTFGEGLRQTRA